MSQVVRPSPLPFATYSFLQATPSGSILIQWSLWLARPSMIRSPPTIAGEATYLPARAAPALFYHNYLRSMLPKQTVDFAGF